MDEAHQGGVGSPAQSVSFCGCGFILGYELGVIQALQELAPEMLGSAAKFFGISSGAIAAAVLACGGNKEIVDEIYSEVMEKSKKSLLGPYSPRFHFLKLLEKGLRKGLTENCHQLASGRLHIGLTRLPDGQKVVISDFCSKEEVIQAVLCSCFIPVIWGWIPPSFRGDNDICPRDCPAAFYSIKVLDCSFQISVENLCRISYGIFPPLWLNIREMQNKGYHDTVYYLQMKKEHGMVTGTPKKTPHKQLQHSLPDAQENRNLSGLLHALAEFFLQSFWNYIKYLQKIYSAKI
ncbi:patatin-like phospholipase domain-containing protein 1 isoform X4 [Alligator sinensis]|uniref:Patatin-like phospholipase domain-containing protein 1 isoform X4 n=1 Tax=Alligator sinensis TaxID=38654 RepID=A0A1U7RSV7_ALLSI|nr:patatin-like phospholipase domain-containing protein 1 isoform X4 [Alligator sinensis]